jgi:hypothetical protein
MDLKKLKLSDEQILNAEKVILAAEKYGINPDFVLPMVMGESRFDHNAKSKAGAIGLMQLMPDTAKSLNVDPTDIDQNIDGGMRLLKELMSNPKIGNDPYKVIIGYNASTETRNKFMKSGDVNELPEETVLHLDNVMTQFGGDLPTPAMKATEEAPTENQPDYNPSGISINEPSADKAEPSPPWMTGVAGGVLGAAAGSAGAGKKVVFDVGSALYNKLGSQATPAGTSGERWAAKTGYGMGEGTVRDVSQRFQKAMPKGKLSRAYAEKLGGTQAMRDAQVAAQAAQAEAEAAQMAENSPLRKAAGYVGRVLNIPVKGALAGFGAGFGAQDAYNRYQEGDIPGAVAAGTGAVASAVAPFAGGAVLGPLSVAIPLGLYARDQMTEMTPEQAAAYKKKMGTLGGMFNPQYDPSFNP